MFLKMTYLTYITVIIYVINGHKCCLSKTFNCHNNLEYGIKLKLALNGLVKRFLCSHTSNGLSLSGTLYENGFSPNLGTFTQLLTNPLSTDFVQTSKSVFSELFHRLNKKIFTKKLANYNNSLVRYSNVSLPLPL